MEIVLVVAGALYLGDLFRRSWRGPEKPAVICAFGSPGGHCPRCHLPSGADCDTPCSHPVAR